MSSLDSDLPQVGIRELRDNLKDYLERVEDGESFEITKNGRTIGMLVPKNTPNDPVSRMIAEGRLLPPRSGSNTLRLPQRVRPSAQGPSTADILDELRADRQ